MKKKCCKKCIAVDYPMDRVGCWDKNCPCHKPESESVIVNDLEFDKVKDNYCPKCYFENDKKTLRKDCPHATQQPSEEWELFDRTNFLVFNKQSGSRFLNEEKLKNFISTHFIPRSLVVEEIEKLIKLKGDISKLRPDDAIYDIAIQDVLALINKK